MHYDAKDPELQERACELCETCVSGKGVKWSNRDSCKERFKPHVDVHYGPDCHFYKNRKEAEKEDIIWKNTVEMQRKQEELYGKLDNPNLSPEEAEKIGAELRATWEELKAIIKETCK